MDLKKVLVKVIDEQGLKSVLLEEVLDGVVKVKLDQIVADSSNAFDDALLAMVYPMIREAVALALEKALAEAKG